MIGSTPPNFSRHDALDAYTRQTLVRTFVSDLRRGWFRNERVTDSHPGSHPDARSEQRHRTEERMVLLEALAKVPPRQRAVIVLRCWEDQSVEDTARLLGCSQGTVKSQAARRRRRAPLGAVGAGAAVVVVAVVAVLVPGLSGTGQRVGPAAGPRPTSAGQEAPVLTGPPATPESSWPHGQTDRTASSGPRADLAVELGDVLTSSLPAGVDVAEGRDELSGEPLLRHESRYDDTADGRELWSCSVELPVAVDAVAESGVGAVGLLVRTARSGVPADPCEALAAHPRPEDGECTVIDVDGAQVGVVEHGPVVDQVAVHGDGTHVQVTRSREFDRSGHPGMAELPTTVEELAAVTVDERFHAE